MAIPKANQITPLQDRVLVERIDCVNGRIALTDQPKSLIGIVKAVGPGRFVDEEFQPTTVKPGQIVVFNSRWNDMQEKENLHLIQEADILSVCDRLPKEAYALPAPEF